uniref:Uncharacterized protein n=1 Tax=Strigamia maritima TaxID=126957 RepID=T1ILL7_STRMM
MFDRAIYLSKIAVLRGLIAIYLFKIQDGSFARFDRDMINANHEPGHLFLQDGGFARNLMEQANIWLLDHPDWAVRTCESVEFKMSSDSHHFAHFEKMTFFEEDQTVRQRYARGFRLWIVQRSSVDFAAGCREQELGYFNVIPKLQSAWCGKPKFQTMDSVLDDFNEVMQNSPLKGKILTIETLRVRFSPFERFIDPERLYYVDHGYKLFIFRIFYEKGAPIDEIIAIEDFKPEVLSETDPALNGPQYEDFTVLTRKVQNWCTMRRSDVRVCNVQTLWAKLKQGHVDSQRMFFTEHKDHNVRTNFVKIIRIAYAHPSRESLVYPDQKPIRICIRTFLPVQLSTRGFFSPPNFELMSQTRDRIAIWILENNVRVISAETCPVRMYTGGERFEGADATYTFNTGGQNEHWIYVLRLFLDGRYPGVPPEMDRSAFRAWNQDPLVVNQPQPAPASNETFTFCCIQ